MIYPMIHHDHPLSLLRNTRRVHQVQRGYACFDAYARISLTVSAQQLLLVRRGEALVIAGSHFIFPYIGNIHSN